MTAQERLPVAIDRNPDHYHDPLTMATMSFLARYKTSTRRAYTTGGLSPLSRA